jgi:hypothetical protein
MLTQVATVLQEAAADLDALWTTRVTDALARANREILNILVGERGYTAAQVAAWDSLDDCVRQLTLFFVFSEAPGQAGLSWEQIKSWDCRNDLRKNAVLTGSVEVTTEEAVSGGALEAAGAVPVDLLDEDEYIEDVAADEDA